MSSESDVPPEVEEAARLAVDGLIPEKSRGKYETALQKFEAWCTEMKIRAISEKVMLAYFQSLIKKYKISTLWSTYSMLKAELNVKKKVDIGNYCTLIALLKRQSVGYHVNKSEILIKENFKNFLKHADDQKYLFFKVTMIFGVAGACRKAELSSMLLSHIKKAGTFLKVTVPETETHIIREFVITSGNIGVNLVDTVEKRMKMRPEQTQHDRLFIRYTNGKCTKQPVGINTIGGVPKKIAEFLGLKNPANYTGHCFRRSSASLLADSGADILKIKQHGGWKSTSVAEGYVESSVENKKRISENMFGETSGVSSEVPDIINNSTLVVNREIQVVQEVA